MSQNNAIGTKLKFQDLPSVPDNQKLTATEFNELTGFQKSPVQQIAGSLDDTDIIIDGTKNHATTIVVAGATRTITANASGHSQGNNIKQRYTFNVDCTITLSGFDATGNNTGTIAPILAGTYDFQYFENRNGRNLEVSQNQITEALKIRSSTNSYFTGDGNVGIKTTIPNSPLAIKGDVNGTAYRNGVRINANSDGSTIRSSLTVTSGDDGQLNIYDSTTALVVIIRANGDSFFNGGNVGIRTISPATRLHVDGAITQNELNADPSDPAEGQSVTWQSDGTESGDDGDIMKKITAGGVTKTIKDTPLETIKIPIGARDTDHTQVTNKVGLHIDYDFTFIGLPTLEFDPIITDGGPTGTSFIVDINVADIDGANEATILSTKLTVDAGEFHSSTAAVPAVLSSNTIAQYKFISIDIDQIGGTLAGKGGFVTLSGYRT